MTTSTDQKRIRPRKHGKSLKTNQSKGFSEKAWEATQDILAESFDKIKYVEQKAETLVDTAAVKTHLGAMEARDKTEAIGKQVQKVRNQLNSIIKRANLEAAGSLKRVSDVCLNLRKRLLN
jgi:hypothetical protein